MNGNSENRRARHSTLSIVGAVFLASGLCFTGCTVTDTIYLQELHTTTSISQPPLHLNAGDPETYFHVSPRVSISPTRVMTGDIKGSGPYKTTDKNLEWDIPAVHIAFDFDWRLTRVFALTGGMNFADANNEGLLGGNLGIGLLFGGESIAGRLDGGLHLQSVSYEAASVVVTTTDSWFSSSTSEHVGYFNDVGVSSATTFYGALTLNTKARESLINGYAQIALGGQKFANFGPSDQYFYGPYIEYIRTDARVQSSSTYVMLSPGLYFNLSETLRLMTGVRLVWELDVTDPSPGTLVLPMAQCEVAF